MANSSIYAAFERMWQHIVAKISTKADANHAHDDMYYTETEVDTKLSSKVDKVTGKGLSTNDYTTTEKNKLSGIATGAQVNQNAFSNIAVSGQTTVAADTTTDTVTFAGSNVTITTDATNDKVTFSVADGSTSAKGVVQLTNSTSSTSTTTAATPNSVKSAYDLANTAKTNAATAQTRADNAYTLAESKVDSLSDLGITATATELNYMDGATSNVQTQIDDIYTEIDAKMNAINPYGVGSFSLNRKAETTVGDYSFAEGYDTTASGHVSHAEGDTTTASGNFSHTEGARTTASGAWSHAEGYWSEAHGQYSHAEGYGTIAVSNGQHVQGKFNIEDNQNKYTHIVGNGTSSVPANIHTLDWDGNAWFEGDVYVGGTSQDDGTKLVKSSDVIPVAQGGTGATTAADARTNLGAVNIAGDTMTGGLTVPLFTVDSNDMYPWINLQGTGGNRGSIFTVSTSGNMVFRNTDKDTSCYEEYQLPATTNLSGNYGYNILTDKNAVTVAQGGTGATTAADARANLGAVNIAGDTMTGSLTINDSENKALSVIIDRTINGSHYKLEGSPSAAAGNFYYEKDSTVLNKLQLTADSTVLGKPLTVASGGTGATTGANALKAFFAAGNTVLSSYQYGATLPTAGNTGRIFFKKV